MSDDLEKFNPDPSPAGDALYILTAAAAPERCFDPLAWETWFATSSAARSVAEDTVGDANVRTIFLGVDRGNGMLYETRIFGGAHGDYVALASTREQALAGHAAAVALAGGAS